MSDKDKYKHDFDILSERIVPLDENRMLEVWLMEYTWASPLLYPFWSKDKMGIRVHLYEGDTVVAEETYAWPADQDADTDYEYQLKNAIHSVMSEEKSLKRQQFKEAFENVVEEMGLEE